METSASYPPPIDRLVTLGETSMHRWPDYLEMGLGPEHIPDLIRMATDPDLMWAGSDRPEVYAPVHAWRALAQLHAVEAVEPLLGLLDDMRDDDWAMEELPVVFERLGFGTVPALSRYVLDRSHETFSRIAAADGLKRIARAEPATREACIGVLVKVLEWCEANDPTLNGFMIADLLDLQAVEAAPAMERAFAEECVDLSVAGDWEEIQLELGLISERKTPRPQYWPFPPGSALEAARAEVAQRAQEEKRRAKTRAKKKMAKASRKKGRRKR